MAAVKHQPEAPPRDAVIESVRPRFLEALRKHQLVLLKLRNALAQSGLAEKDYALMHNIAHRLHGTAATFLYPEVSKAASVLEYALDSQAGERDGQLILDATDALLKCCRTVQRDSTDAAETPPSKPAAPAPDAAPRILLVEDDPTTQLVVREILAGEGRVDCADNADSARRLIDKAPPELMIVDNYLAGGVTGIEFVEALKADAKYAELPVVMMTSSDKPDDIMRALMAGAVDYIAKPIKPAAFVEKIGKILRARRTLVLIADDDKPVRDILAQKFHALGVKTLEAVKGEEALSLVREHKPNLVLLDRMMPGYDGVTVLQKMRNDPALRTIPVVFLTARRNESDILEGLNLGAEDYIVKPFNADIVITRCMRLIKGGRAVGQ